MKQPIACNFREMALTLYAAIIIILSLHLSASLALSATTDTNKDGITVEVIGSYGPGEIRITKNGSTTTIPTPDGDSPGAPYGIPYAYNYVIAAGPHNFCLVYSGERFLNGSQDGVSMFQLYDYQGKTIGNETIFSDQVDGGASTPSITDLSDGNYLSVFFTNNPKGYPTSPRERVGYVVGRVWSGDGLTMKETFIVAPDVLVGPPAEVTQTADNQVKIFYQSMDGTTIAWNTVYGSDTGQLTLGTPGNDNLYGNGGNDEVVAEPGNDYVDGGTGTDNIGGGAGDDRLNGGVGGDILDGGDGTDAASYETADAGVTAVLETVPAPTASGARVSYMSNTGDAAGDVYRNIENLIGSRHSDTLIGNKFRNTLTGGKSGDILDGRSGIDIAGYSNSEVRVVANLSNPNENQGDAYGDTYISIEGLEGSFYADSLIGNDFANHISGGLGDDSIVGLLGKDVLTGNEGADSIDCGLDLDADIVKYMTIADTPIGSGRDQIINFKIANDKIDLSKIDANTKVKGNQAFLFSNSTPTANSVWFVKRGKDILVRGDVDGNTKADFEFLIKNIATIMQTSFVL